jgi:arabinan endo-1,5-alpha-L-arabinosidase
VEIPATGDTTYVHDPCLAKSGGKWFIFSTGNGVPMRVSEDLKKWRYVREAFPQIPDWAKEAVPGTRGFWAPDIIFRDGKWWLYYCVSTFGSQRSAMGVATATTLTEETVWKDEGLVFASQRGDPYNAIDPNIYTAPEGTVWLSFGSFWQGLYLLPIDKATGKPPVGAKPGQIAARPGSTAIEAPYLFHRNGWHYLLISHDFCCRGANSTYKLAIGRSKNVAGPYLDREGKPLNSGGGTLLRRGRGRWRGQGHGSVYQDGKDYWLVHHAYDTENKALPTLRIVKLDWTRDGWCKVTETSKLPVYKNVVGFWEHRPENGAATMLELKEGGATSTESATWVLTGKTLEICWKNVDAPGGAWVDTCTLGRGFATYEGKNQSGLPLYGTRVA